jgi:hypothetical protein
MDDDVCPHVVVNPVGWTHRKKRLGDFHQVFAIEEEKTKGWLFLSSAILIQTLERIGIGRYCGNWYS